MELAPTLQAKRLEPATELDELVCRAADSARLNEDHRGVSLKHTRVRLDGTWMFEGEVGRFSRHALSQLCARLDLPTGGSVPAGYVARCPSHLAAENLNHWLSLPKREGQQVLVRTRGEIGKRQPLVRAVLSDRYAAVDHQPLLEVLASLAPQHGLSVQGWSMDDEQMTVRLLVGTDHPASLDDPLRIGLHVANSEVGLSRISVTALITRLVCTNGLVVKVADLGGVQRRHIGHLNGNLQELVLAAIPKVLEQADEAARRFAKLREIPAPAPLEPFLAKTAAEAELPETVLPSLQSALEGESLYDVVNAFTLVAQRYAVPERLRIETTMSRFLGDRRNWN